MDVSGHAGPRRPSPEAAQLRPFDSLCWRDGRHAHDPNDWGYPQLGGGAWPYAQGDTPSAPGFPTHQSVDLRMRERPDYGTIGDRYGAHDNFGDMYGPYCGPFSPEWYRARATNRGWR